MYVRVDYRAVCKRKAVSIFVHKGEETGKIQLQTLRFGSTNVINNRNTDYARTRQRAPA